MVFFVNKNYPSFVFIFDFSQFIEKFAATRGILHFNPDIKMEDHN
jgi:hypothetical protein